MNKRKKKFSLSMALIYLFLIVLVFIYIAPLVWMFSVSLKTNAEIFTSPFALPERVQWENYTFAWTAGFLGKATLNSAIVCVTALILSLIIGSMAAFAIARMKWKYSKIAVPLSKTGLFVTGLMSFVANWNELLLAMVFISDETKKALPVSLSKFVGPYNTNYVQMFAAIIIAIIPTIIVYCCFSNQIVEGLTTGAVKG